MWLFARDGFVSIVAVDKNTVQARARDRAHLEKLFPGHEIIATPQADYPYRVILPRSFAAAFAYEQVENIDYSNFKSAAEVVVLNEEIKSGKKPRTWWYIDALHEVWEAVWSCAKTVRPVD